MISKKKALTFAILLSLLVISLLVGGLWLLDWYWLEPIWAVVVQIIVAVLAAVGIGALIYSRLRRPPVDEDAKKREDWREEEIQRTFNHVWRKHSRLSANPYLIPWYVHLTEDIENDQLWLQQMGFEAIEPADNLPEDLVAVRFWASDDAIIATIDLLHPKEGMQKSINTLVALILSKRSRQAFNGVLCAVDLGKLINSTEIAVSELSQKYRSVLEDLNKAVGLTLPTYCTFTHMSQIQDLCELFSPLEESERELPFGALRDVEESKEYDKAWFDESFEALSHSLTNSLSSSLKGQLNADYRDSALVGIYQLSALRYDVEDFLSLTFSQHQFDEIDLFFRGYFFVNVGGESENVDIISTMHASELGFETLSNIHTQSKSLSLFGKGLFRSCVLKEAPLVGFNKKREITYRTTRWVVSCGLVILFVGFVATIKAGFDYQQELDNKALAMLDRYKENLEKNAIQPDDLASPVFSLYELREIVQLYDEQHHPWYVSSWLPSSSISGYVHDAYFGELNSELLTLMRDYIMKDMFVYNSLDDKVKTLELLNLQQILYNPERHSSTSLVNYYIDALNEEGSGDASLIKRFKLLAEDALSTSAIPPAFDEQLLGLVRKSLSTDDVSELLYQHILQHRDFARRVDIRKSLNPVYEQVFTFNDGFSGYLIPYAFTRDGFQDLSNETGFQLASEAITAYEGVMGRINGEAEMNRINRQLRERYIKDYIQYWNAFVSNVQLTEVSSWGGSEQQLDLVTDANFSPITQFYSVVSTNTNLIKSTLESKEQQKEEQQKEGQQADETSPLQSNNGSAMERVAESITYPFRHIHGVIHANQTGQSSLDIALTNLTALRDWVNKSKEIQSKGHYFLEQLENADSSNPIARLHLSADDYNVPLLPELMDSQATLVNGLALDAVREVINEDWSKVTHFYLTRLANHYPIKSNAQTDVLLSDFEAFFKPEGEFDQFSKKYANHLDMTISREIYLNGFIPHQYLSLSWQYPSFSDSVERIQKQLFTGKDLGFNFSIKAVEMSPSLTRFALEANLKFFEYQNGPKLWRLQSWPIPANQMQDISVMTRDTEGVVQREKFSGVWSWFRVAEKMKGSTQVGSNEILWRYSSTNGEVNLEVKRDGIGQPFEPDLFTNLGFPTWL